MLKQLLIIFSLVSIVGAFHFAQEQTEMQNNRERKIVRKTSKCCSKRAEQTSCRNQ